MTAACLMSTHSKIVFFFIPHYMIVVGYYGLYPATQSWRGIMVSCWLSVYPSVRANISLFGSYFGHDNEVILSFIPFKIH